jgi:hypothetical protein
MSFSGTITASVDTFLNLASEIIGHQNFSAANPNFENYTFTAGLQWVQTGTTSAFPKYGVYAAYSDVRNNVSVGSILTMA